MRSLLSVQTTDVQYSEVFKTNYVHLA